MRLYNLYSLFINSMGIETLLLCLTFTADFNALTISANPAFKLCRLSEVLSTELEKEGFMFFRIKGITSFLKKFLSKSFERFDSSILYSN